MAAAMSHWPKRSLPMTRPSACSPPAPAKPRLPGSGLMPAMNAPGAVMRHPRRQPDPRVGWSRNHAVRPRISRANASGS